MRSGQARCCGRSMGPSRRVLDSCQIGHKNVQIRLLHNNAAESQPCGAPEPRQLHVLPVVTARKSTLDLQRAVDKSTRSIDEASWTIGQSLLVLHRTLCARRIHYPPPHQSKQNLQASKYPEKPAWDQMKVLRSLCPSRDQLAISSQRDHRADPK